MDKYDLAYLEMAKIISKCSEAKRLKVGAIIVKDRCIVSEGLNGTPAGWYTNECEDETGLTKPEVIHAEENSILKAARTGRATNGSTLYCTHSPCKDCAKAIIGAGVIKVVYEVDYRCQGGVEMLKKANIDVIKAGD